MEREFCGLKGGDLMIEAIKNIGELELSKLLENNGTVLDIFLEDPSDDGKYDKVLFIKLQKHNSSIVYEGVEERGFRTEEVRRYLYRSGSGARGADVTPTAKLTEAKKTIPNKIIRAVTDALNFIDDNSTQERQDLEEIKRVLEEKEKRIIDDIQIKQKEMGKGAKLIISLMLCKENEEKWVGDWEIFCEKFKADCRKLFAEKYSKISTSQDKVCSICFEKTEVFGFTSTFQFYTLDKPGYVAGGFRQQEAWKNYPVCFECGAKLELGKKYLERHLTKSFYFRRMMIIPKTLWEEDLSTVLEKLRRRLKSRREDSEEDSKTQSEVESIGHAENSIIYTLGSMGQGVTYNLLFFEEKQSGAVFNILLNIEDVLPSRLHFIYEQLKQVNSLEQFGHFPVGKGEQPFKLHPGVFGELFPYKTHNRYFLEMIYSLIAKRPIDAKFLISRIMDVIVEKFNEPDDKKKFYDSFIAWRYFQLILYLGRLELLPDLFKNNGGEKSVREIAKYNLKDFSSAEEMFDTFFVNQNGLYNHPAAKACFMVGYLAQHLINFQRKELDRTPFKVQLKGLKLKEKDVRGLVAKLQDKFMDYEDGYQGSFYPCRTEFELMTKYIQEAGKDWPMSMPEIGFYVAVGMNGKNLFTFKKKEGKGND